MENFADIIVRIKAVVHIGTPARETAMVDSIAAGTGIIIIRVKDKVAYLLSN